MAHSKTVCREHKVVLKQCRCPGPKIKYTVECPGESCPGRTLDEEGVDQVSS